MDEKTDVDITINNNTAIVAFKTVSISSVEAIAAVSKQINQFLESNSPKVIIVDFKEVSFFSSQVLGLLLDMRAKLQKDNGQVVISAINPQMHRVFKITNLDKIFAFFPDKESAIAQTGKN